MVKSPIVTCDKCEQIYPKIIFTCVECCVQLGWARGYNLDHPSRHICFECWGKLNEKAWMYDDLNK